MTALVEVENATRVFDDVTAVDKVSLTVEPGEVVGLLGANGAGKTTLIRMILGLIKPTSGAIMLMGEPPSRAGRSRLGYVPQGTGLYEDLTVAENLGFIADAYGVPRPELGPELGMVSNRTVGRISLGLRRRAAFTAALSHQPELLLLDEPTSGVGPLGRAELWATIGSAASSGAGVLVTTHHMEEAEQCDRVVMLALGRVAAEGTAAAIIESVQSVEIITDDWHAAFSALDAADLKPTLLGSHLRVTDTEEAKVRDILSSYGISATVQLVEAGFEEAFVTLSGR